MPYGAVLHAGAKQPGDGTITEDSFDRTDSTTTMGSTDGAGSADPLVWTPNTATWGITSNLAYTPGSPPLGLQATTVVDTGVSDCTIKVTLSTSGDGGVCFRSTDNNNHFVWANEAARLFKREAGSYAAVGDLVAAGANGDVLEFVLSGTSIIVKRNGSTILTTSSSFQQTATKHGLRTNIHTLRFNDFSVTVP